MKDADAKGLIAAAFSSLDEMQALISLQPRLIYERIGLEETPLHYLAVENQIEAVQLLIEHGAEVNVVNQFGETPLSASASLGYFEMVVYLIESGALPQIQGQETLTLHEAVISGDANIVSRVLAAGALIDQQDSLSETALHLAAESDNRLEILHVLLAAGANTKLKRIFGETAHDVAIQSGAKLCSAALAIADKKA